MHKRSGHTPSSKHVRVYNKTAHRLRELERIVRHRHGMLPDTDDADIILDQIACCYVRLLWNAGKKPDFAAVLERLDLWCECWARDVSVLTRRDVCGDALRRPRLDDADQCAAAIRLTYEERTAWRITTIGAIDADKKERAKRRKARKLVRDRDRRAAERRDRGAVPRAEYEAESASRTRPWEAAGVSRRTWYRRRGTGASPTSTSFLLGDGLVPKTLPNGWKVIVLPRLPLSSLCSGTSFADGPCALMLATDLRRRPS
jgi:hypothetical protein